MRKMDYKYWILVILNFIHEFTCAKQVNERQTPRATANAKEGKGNEPKQNANLLLNVWPDYCSLSLILIFSSHLWVNPNESSAFKSTCGWNAAEYCAKQEEKKYPGSSIIIFNPRALCLTLRSTLCILTLCYWHRLTNIYFTSHCVHTFIRFSFPFLFDKMIKEEETRNSNYKQTSTNSKHMHIAHTEMSHTNERNSTVALTIVHFSQTVRLNGIYLAYLQSITFKQ